MTRFGEISPVQQKLEIFGNVLRFIWFWAKFSTHYGTIRILFVQIFIVKMAKYWKNNLAIWSHWTRYLLFTVCECKSGCRYDTNAMHMRTNERACVCKVPMWYTRETWRLFRERKRERIWLLLRGRKKRTLNSLRSICHLLTCATSITIKKVN